MDKEELIDRFLGCMIGTAVGDALGTRVEFLSPEYVKNNPVTDMLGGGKYSLEPGQFTDDTSMALCVLESILVKGGKYDPADILEKWWKWFDEGHLSPNQVCFDIGQTTLKFIQYCRSNKVAESRKMVTEKCGNGSLMRLAPIILYNIFESLETCTEASGNHSKITHYAVDGVDSCRYMASLIHSIFNRPGITKEELLSPDFLKEYWNRKPFHSSNVQKVVEESGKKTKEDVCGKGLVSTTLEAVLWSFQKFDSFSECVLNVINLGDDADTTGAICGYLCGAYYGLKSIPTKWVEKIYFLPMIREMTMELFRIAELRKEGREGDYEMSKDCKEMYDHFIFLEESLQPIKRRLEPGPKFYKSLQEFDQEVEEIKKKFFEFSGSGDEKVWKYFRMILERDREDIAPKLGRPGLPAIPGLPGPPPPPSLDDLKISSSSAPKTTSTSENRGALMEMIKSGGFKLKKVKKEDEK